MKRLLSTTCLSSLLLAAATASASTIQLTLNVAEDAYIQQHMPWTGNGSAERLFATQGTATGSSEKIYLLFDASNVPGEIVDIIDIQAVFTNQYAGRSGHTFLVTGPGATDWTEDSITYDNAPANDPATHTFLAEQSTQIGSFEAVSAQYDTASFIWVGDDPEATKQMVIEALNTGSRKVAFGIHRDSTNRNIAYASKESTSHAGPRMILEVAPDRQIGSVIVDVVEDAHVSQALPNLNFGTDTILYATEGINAEASEKIYLKFDASGLPGNIVEIVDFEAVFLNEYARYGGVSLLTGPGVNDWTENSITYNNAPANDPFYYDFLPSQSVRLGSLQQGGYGETVGMAWFGNAQDQLRDALNSGDRIVTVGMFRNSTNRNIAYASRENEEFHPARLVLLVEGVEGGSTGFSAWLETHFTSDELSNPAISGPEADPAGDNVSNLLKYALGLDPWVSSAHLLPAPSIDSDGDDRYLTLTFSRPEAVDDVSYAVEAAGDLNGSPEPTVEVSTTIENGFVHSTYRDTVPVDEANRRFLRLRVSSGN